MTQKRLHLHWNKLFIRLTRKGWPFSVSFLNSVILDGMSLSITSTIKTHPKHSYEAIKDAILGKRYELSLVFIGKTRAATLNQKYRNKTYSPNVLSFPLDERTGEIFICPQVATSEAAKYNLSPKNYVAFLFIHGCLHLKGYDHSDTMDKLERKYLKKFELQK